MNSIFVFLAEYPYYAYVHRIGQGFTTLSLLRTLLASFPAYGSSPLKAEYIRPDRSFLIVDIYPLIKALSSDVLAKNKRS